MLRAFSELLVSAADELPFEYVDPPFNFNAPDVACYRLEVSGLHLLESMRRRLGWTSFDGKTLMDFGCGVRFAATIHNLALPLARYVGVDVHAEAVAWLSANLTGPRYTFAHIRARNSFYNPNGILDSDAMVRLNLPPCDTACMFSVITHQNPEEARLTFQQLRRVLEKGSRLYFTAFVDEGVPYYTEGLPANPGASSTYGPDALLEIVRAEGWRADAVYRPVPFQQHAFICTAN
jgi:SAM-dependent methyltransferase